MGSPVCHSPHGTYYYHDDGKVTFDWYKADTIGQGSHTLSVGMNANSTIVLTRFTYHQNCSEIPPDVPEVERYSANVLDRVPSVPKTGWTDFYYTSNTSTPASDCEWKDFRGFVNIPVDECINDPAG